MKYDRELVGKTLRVMQKIKEVQKKREEIFYKNRCGPASLHEIHGHTILGTQWLCLLCGVNRMRDAKLKEKEAMKVRRSRVMNNAVWFRMITRCCVGCSTGGDPGQHRPAGPRGGSEGEGAEQGGAEGQGEEGRRHRLGHGGRRRRQLRRRRGAGVPNQAAAPCPWRAAQGEGQHTSLPVLLVTHVSSRRHWPAIVRRPPLAVPLLCMPWTSRALKTRAAFDDESTHSHVFLGDSDTSCKRKDPRQLIEISLSGVARCLLFDDWPGLRGTGPRRPATSAACV